MTDALALDEVTKTFGTVRAVDGLSARIPAGSIYGFLGPNGAGKTTTLRMVMNIISPDTGRIEILGQSSLGEVPEEVGYMPEERGLYPKMKLRAALSYFAALKGMRKSVLAGEIHRRLEEMGLAQWVDRKVEDLSRGMQQKLQFIVASINHPDVLILDEPFAGLDPVSLDVLKDAMLRMREAGKTILFSTHMMEQAEALCDCILLINKGRKVIDGSLDEVRARHRSNAVLADLEGETAFIDDLPMVQATARKGRKLEISLRKDSDSQDLLRSLVGKVRVRSFEERVPSLREIFVHLVGDGHE